jgi:hypothetical protein
MLHLGRFHGLLAMIVGGMERVESVGQSPEFDGGALPFRQGVIGQTLRCCAVGRASLFTFCSLFTKSGASFPELAARGVSARDRDTLVPLKLESQPVLSCSRIPDVKEEYETSH